MPSVRVRRGSQYASLIGEDNTPDQTHPRQSSRPRSRTLASIYNVPSQLAPSSGRDTSESGESTGQLREPASGPSTDRKPYAGKIAGSILSPGLRGYKSYDYISENAKRRRTSSAEARNGDGTITLEGSQANVVVPDGGYPGLLESNLSLASAASNPFGRNDSSLNHEDDIVEHLDVIDPEISTISNLANAANAILIPPIGVYSRKPVVFLPKVPVSDAERASTHEDDLDRHVEEVLSKRIIIRRTLRGVWAFVKTPMGFITAVYGFCVVFWGAAIVLFLAKIINLHNSVQQGFWVEVSSQVENALFTVTGVGLIPWRVVDTYRILRILHFKRLTRKLRAQAKLPELYDEDDLPDPKYDPNYVHVLSEKQEKELHHHQRHFAKSQTWYRPHGTPTHRAFPINTALIICCFNDGNSIFQIILCGTMWGLNRFQRPAWSTGILIPASFLCGIVSAVFIWRGGQKTKRTKEVEERLRLALTIEHHPDKFKEVETEDSQNLTSETRREELHPSTDNDGSSFTKIQQSQASDEIIPRERDSSIFIEENMNIPPSTRR